MMQQIQAALFDLDGTLTNTLQDIANAMNRSLLQHGLPTWTTEEYKYLVGDGVKILSSAPCGNGRTWPTQCARPIRTGMAVTIR